MMLQYAEMIRGIPVMERKQNSQWTNLLSYTGTGKEGDNNDADLVGQTKTPLRVWQPNVKTIYQGTSLTKDQKAQLPKMVLPRSGAEGKNAKFGRTGLFCPFPNGGKKYCGPSSGKKDHSHEKRHTPSEALAAFVQVLDDNTVPFTTSVPPQTCLQYYEMALDHPMNECASRAHPNKSKDGGGTCSMINNSPTLCVPCRERAAIQSDEVKEDVFRWWNGLPEVVDVTGPPAPAKTHYHAFGHFLQRMIERMNRNTQDDEDGIPGARRGFGAGGMGGGGGMGGSSMGGGRQTQSLSGGGGGGGLGGGGKTKGLGGSGGSSGGKQKKK